MPHDDIYGNVHDESILGPHRKRKILVCFITVKLIVTKATTMKMIRLELYEWQCEKYPSGVHGEYKEMEISMCLSNFELNSCDYVDRTLANLCKQ